MSGKHLQLGGLSIDPVAYGSQGSAVLGIRDSGKTYSATWFAERIFEAGIPFIAFDPIGVWRFLRVPGGGRGYPVVVAGGQEGDLPLTVASAPEIVRAAMANGVSLVIDLFDINLSKADWKRIVTACVRVLLHENAQHGLRHVFIEEAAEFAPQRVGPDQGQVYAEIEKLARMGGNSRLGYTLINQRAEEVNKAVLELCDNLFLHRQKGRNSLTALSKWLDIGNVTAAKEIVATLSTLPTGECWAWPAGSEEPVRVKMPAKNSLHPDRRVMRGAEKLKTAAVDVGSFVETMRSSLGKIEQEAKANDPAILKRQIAELQKQIASNPVAKINTPDPAAIEAAEKRGLERGRREGLDLGLREGWREGVSSVYEALSGLRERPEIAGSPSGKASGFGPDTAGSNPAPAAKPSQLTRPQGPEFFASAARQPRAVEGGGALGAERKPLALLAAAYPAGYTEPQWASLAGFKRTGGTWGTYKSRLRTKGLIEQRGDLWYATAAGIEEVGENIPAMPSTPQERLAMWKSKVAGVGPMLDVLRGAYPNVVERDDLAIALNLAPGGGTFGTYLSRLRSNGLIEEPERGIYRISSAIMGDI